MAVSRVDRALHDLKTSVYEMDAVTGGKSSKLLHDLLRLLVPVVPMDPDYRKAVEDFIEELNRPN